VPWGRPNGDCHGCYHGEKNPATDGLARGSLIDEQAPVFQGEAILLTILGYGGAPQVIQGILSGA
jgi:hypothetical protein